MNVVFGRIKLSMDSQIILFSLGSTHHMDYGAALHRSSIRTSHSGATGLYPGWANFSLLLSLSDIVEVKPICEGFRKCSGQQRPEVGAIKTYHIDWCAPGLELIQVARRWHQLEGHPGCRPKSS